MATFQARVENYTGTVGDAVALATWLNQEAKRILNSLPTEAIDRYAGTFSIPDTGGDLIEYRLVEVYTTAGRKSRQMSYSRLNELIDSGSIYYATASSPVHVFHVSKIWIFAGGVSVAGAARGVQYPTILVTDSTITNFPVEYEQAVVLYAAIQEIISRLRAAITSMAGLTYSSPTAPTALIAPAYNYTDASLGTYTATTIGAFGTAPTYVKPTSLADFTNITTYVSTEVDPEKASAEAGKLKAQTEQHQMDLYNELNEFNKENIEYQSSITRVIKQAELDQDRVMKEADRTTDLSIINRAKQLEKDISLYRDALARHQSETALYAQQVNEQLAGFTSVLQQKTGEVDTLIKLLSFLREEYKASL